MAVPTKTMVGGTGRSRQWQGTAVTPWTPMSGYQFKDNTVVKGPGWPDWKYRIKYGLPATTSLSGTKWTYTGSNVNVDISYDHDILDGNYTRYFQTQGDVYSNILLMPSGPSAMDKTSTNNTALRKLVGNIKYQQTRMQSGVFIAELSEALRMIRNPFKILYRNQYDHIRNVRKNARKFRGGKPAKVHERIAEAWLETSFGWQPFVNDLDTGMSTLAEIGIRNPPVKGVSGYGKTEKRSVPVFSAYSPIATVGTAAQWTQEEISIKYHGTIGLEDPSVKTELHRFGLTIYELVPTIWEIIPYSFLADYFANIGDIIQAACLNRVNERWLERGERSKVESFVSFSAKPGPAPTGYRLVVNACRCSGTISAVREDVQRINFSGQSLVPSLEFRIPGMGLKWLNIAALGVTHTAAVKHLYRKIR